MFGICNVHCLGMLRVVGRIGRGRLVRLVGRAFFMPVDLSVYRLAVVVWLLCQMWLVDTWRD